MLPGMPYSPPIMGLFIQSIYLSGFYSPAAILTLIYFSILHAFHFWLGGVFTYLYTRQLGLSRVPALISSICFMLGGFLLGHAGHRNVIQTYIWLPLILYFLDKALLQRGTFWSVLAGVFLAIFLAGRHANFFYFILFIHGFLFPFSGFTLSIREKSLKKMTGDAFFFIIMGLFGDLGDPIGAYFIHQPHDLPWDPSLRMEGPICLSLINLVHFLIPAYPMDGYGYRGTIRLHWTPALTLCLWEIFQSKDPRTKFWLDCPYFFYRILGRTRPLI